MSILINKNTRVLVQGIMGQEGSFHTRLMIRDGTNIVSGTSPGRGGEWVLEGKIPVFDGVRSAVDATGANTSVIFIPARYAVDAIYEAVDSGIKLIVVITEGIPIQDILRLKGYLSINGVRLVGPNTPGIYSPGESRVGIIPGFITTAGSVGVVSRSGTLTYEVLNALKQKAFGTSTCVGIGGDPVVGTSFTDVLELFEEDPHTEEIVLIGEIGGMAEENAASFIANHGTKPVVAYIAGLSAPPEKKMGHAGALIERSAGTAGEKIKALQNAGVLVASDPEEVAVLLGKKF
jgi:succinyl-CoA synthetase alpha subunit